MKNKFLEAGKIVNTHGINGDVKIEPWADDPGFLAGLSHLYIDGEPVKILSARVQKGCVIAALEGVADIDAAIRLKNKVVHIDRDEAPIGAGRYFVVDLVGSRAIDAETGEELGILVDVLKLPSNDVYVIKGEREIMVPAVEEFIAETNIEEGWVKLRLIEGM